MKPIALFVCSSFNSHIMKSLSLGKEYSKKGFEVHLCMFSESDWITASEVTQIHTVESKLIGYKTGETRKGWRGRYKVYKEEKQAKERKKELIKVVQLVRPEVILFDEFCIQDYPLIKPQFPDIKYVVQIQTPPNFGSYRVPPLSSLSPPNAFTFLDWWVLNVKHFITQHSVLFKKPDRYFRGQLRKITRNTGIKYSFGPNHYPVFKGVERWHFWIPELDFVDEGNKANYLGPVIDFRRKEETYEFLEIFLQIAKSKPDSKVIYCSFGTVINTILSEEVLLDFYKKIINIAKQNPNWYIILLVPPTFLEQIKPSSINLHITSFVPQLRVLKECDLHISHGGSGSVLESLAFGVPMLCLPPNTKTDCTGNTARAVYHGVALHAKLNASLAEIQKKILELINNQDYTLKAKDFANLLANKYNKDFVGNQDIFLDRK